MSVRANARARARDREGGQMLILAGVVLILAFLLAAFAVSEITSQQQQLQRGAQSDLPKLFREARDKVANTMAGLSYQGIDNATVTSRFDSQIQELEQQGRGRGVHMVLRLANGTDVTAGKGEFLNFTKDVAGAACPGYASNRTYNMLSYNASRNYTDKQWDCGDDGIVWDRDVLAIRGLIAYLFMADPAARVEETFVIAVG